MTREPKERPERRTDQETWVQVKPKEGTQEFTGRFASSSGSPST